MHPQLEAALASNIHIQRVFQAPREKVFAAFTDPELVKKWFVPLDDHKIHIDSWDARLGGRYAVELTAKSGPDRFLTGLFEECEKPGLLIFTWGWEGYGCWGENRVTAEFKNADGATELKLTQGLFPTKKLAQEQEEIWKVLLDLLEKSL